MYEVKQAAVGRRLLLGVGVLKDVVEGNLEDLRDLKRHLERWRVPATFDGDDGLTCHADPVCQVRLRHLAVRESENPDGVRDSCRLSHY